MKSHIGLDLSTRCDKQERRKKKEEEEEEEEERKKERRKKKKEYTVKYPKKPATKFYPYVDCPATLS